MATNSPSMMRLEAEADHWLEGFDGYPKLLEDIASVSRLSQRAPEAVRERFIKRQTSLIDSLVRQAFIEGFSRGMLSRSSTRTKD